MNEKLTYIEKLETQIDEAKAALSRLKEEKQQAIKEGQHEEIERLEEHLEQAQVKLEDIREAAEEAWQEVKEGIDILLNKLGDSLKKLMQKEN
ncbi:hypothetical protein IQ256_15360 [cf. Phormidesmis sp. LEGE 11477]|nr:hypothetical protein [cf. Phormidesmis sp. LEGE 11477]